MLHCEVAAAVLVLTLGAAASKKKKGVLHMAHAEKYTRASANGVNRHDERSQYDGVQSRKNENIYWERTNRNYAFESMAKRNEQRFAEFEEEHPELMQITWDSAHDTVDFVPADGAYKTYTAEDYIKDFGNLDDVTMSNRKDLKAVVSWVVTMPEKVKGNEQERFFEETYAFLRSRYCDKVEKAVGMSPVISAVVHLDETTPHMHFKFIPTYFDKKTEKWRVSAKEVLNRRDLQTFHKDLSAHMSRVFGRDIGIENGATRDGNKTVEELKRQKDLESDIEILEQRVTALQTNENALRNDLKNKGEELQGVEQDLSERLVDLSAVKSELNTLLAEIETLRKGIADIEKLSSQSPKTENEWQERFQAVPRKLGKGYIVDGEQLDKASKLLAKQDKQLVALSAEVKSLRNDIDRYKFGYESPLQKVEKTRKVKEISDTLNAYKSVISHLPTDLQRNIERLVREQLHGITTKDRGKER